MIDVTFAKDHLDSAHASPIRLDIHYLWLRPGYAQL